MKKTIQILLIALLFFGCESTPKKEYINQNCIVNSPSKNLQKIARYLTTKDYEYTSQTKNKDLVFDYVNWATFKTVESIKYIDCRYIEFSFKKKKTVNGNFYPEFRIMEICFESNAKAEEYSEKLSRIIKQQEKNYGYIIVNGDRLLYIQTGVNMYGFIIYDFQKEFQKIIEN